MRLKKLKHKISAEHMKVIYCILLSLFFVLNSYAEGEKVILNNHEPQIERGQPSFVIDSLGNVFAIPKKIILLNANIENHRISPKTEQYIKDFIYDNPEVMKDVKVRLNQWTPAQELGRLAKNKHVSFWWRIFPGIPVTLWSSMTGRILGGDNYNPYTNTVSVYSDDPAVALHEVSHAKDFMSKVDRVEADAYAVGRILPPVALYQEYTASDQAIEHIKGKKDLKGEMRSYSTLYPAFGTYVGGFSGFQYGDIGGAFIGHGVGLWKRHERALYIDNSWLGEVCTNLESDPLAKNLLQNSRESDISLEKTLYAPQPQIKFEGR